MIKFISSEKFILPIVYIIIGLIIYNLIRIVFKKISKTKFVDKKKVTIISLIKNIIKYLVLILVVLAILQVYGVDTTGIIASIGVFGVIIGLALQDIIADFLKGIYILFDNQYTLGDTVVIDGFLGEVIGFGLMSTKIKAPTGEVMTLSNSSFKKVINYSVYDTTYYIDIDVSYDTDISKLEKVLNEMKDEVEKINGYTGNYKLLGISEFASSSIRYMVTLQCKNNLRYQVKRDFNMILKENLNKAGIEIPYNKLDVNIRGKHE